MNSITRRRFLGVLGAGGVPGVGGVAADEVPTAWDTAAGQSGPGRGPVDVRVIEGADSRSLARRAGTSPGGALGLHPAVLLRVGIEAGQQVRLEWADRGEAVYTVLERPGAAEGTALVSEAGADRVDLPAGTTRSRGRIETPVPARLEDVAAAEAAGQFVEEVIGDGNRVAVLAPHGGDIEAGTDHQARRAAGLLRDATAWLGRGWHPDGAFDRWHVTSTALHPASYPGLARIAERRFETAVSFHGFRGEGVLVGGGADQETRQAVRRALAAALDDTPVKLAEDGPYGGVDPANPVNWLTAGYAGGIQIEQSAASRADHGRTVANTVASTLESAP